MRLQRSILLMLLVAAAIQIAYFYPQLPDGVASHWNGAGRPNGSMPKGVFVGIYVAVLAFMALMFNALPGSIMKYPDSKISLPNKRYWLSPERRAQTGEIIARYMGEAGNATIAFFIIVFQFAFRANVSESRALPEHMGLLIVAFVAYMVVWMVRFVRAFKLPPGAEAEAGAT